jgi:hypothetical protein
LQSSYSASGILFHQLEPNDGHSSLPWKVDVPLDFVSNRASSLPLQIPHPCLSVSIAKHQSPYDNGGHTFGMPLVDLFAIYAAPVEFIFNHIIVFRRDFQITPLSHDFTTPIHQLSSRTGES